MRRHSMDRLSLVFGVVYVGIAVAALAGLDLLEARWGWAWPVMLLAIGVALLPGRREVRPDARPDAFDDDQPDDRSADA
ncbi:MAG: hypothetical protein KY469_16860 [Actinobacteria bacterium]|nr:hypothetical protein [Actinomycetota bacterium]